MHSMARVGTGGNEVKGSIEERRATRDPSFRTVSIRVDLFEEGKGLNIGLIKGGGG